MNKIDNWDIVHDIKEALEDIEEQLESCPYNTVKGRIIDDIAGIYELLEGIENQSATRYSTRHEMLKTIASGRYEVKEIDEAIAVTVYNKGDKERKYGATTTFRKEILNR